MSAKRKRLWCDEMEDEDKYQIFDQIKNLKLGQYSRFFSPDELDLVFTDEDRIQRGNPPLYKKYGKYFELSNVHLSWRAHRISLREVKRHLMYERMYPEMFGEKKNKVKV